MTGAALFHSRFPARFCINLGRRPDRWQRMTLHLENRGLQFTRFNAIDAHDTEVPAGWSNRRGAWACLQSHREVVKYAAATQLPSVCIFEDDVELHRDFDDLFSTFVCQLPPDWDAVYLGGLQRRDPVPAGSHIARIVDSDSTFAWILRDKLFSSFLEITANCEVPVDVALRTLQKRHRFFCPVPPLAWVTEDYSDVQERIVNHWWLRDGVAADGELSDDLLSRTSLILMPSPRIGKNSAIPDFLERRYRMLIPETRHAEYQFLIDSDVYVSPWDLRACLLKCREFGRITTDRLPVRLTAAETASFMRSGPPLIGAARNAGPPEKPIRFTIERRRTTGASEGGECACPVQPLLLCDPC